ncbi:AraC family transcriptional regulator [Nesterenkonia sp. MY13]|uniref:AraC family transcriptional regulator n=1 Tax=Nesterenkonia sedimenti TaxID=1463632 RepID=A0A7X8TL01_9MICC|nr:AraC family transcriptional regulator [Nesterenkonia sedimenti]
MPPTNSLGSLAVERFTPAGDRFPVHSHDEFVISVNSASIIREKVRLDRDSSEVGHDAITIYNPGQVQSSTAVTSDGSAWACFSVYLEPEVAGSLVGQQIVEVEDPVVEDAGLAKALRSAYLSLDQRLAHETTAWVIAETLHRARQRKPVERPVGLTPYAWHLQPRIREGRRRLRSGQAVSVIASDLGFADQAHFHRHFRAAYAETPRQFRSRAGCVDFVQD